MQEKIEFLFKTIERFDHYIEASDSKASIILAFNAVIIGTILLEYDNLLKLFEKPAWCLSIAILLIILLDICLLSSTFFALCTIHPFLESGNITFNYSTLLFFKSVAEMKLDDYQKSFEEYTEKNWEGDLIRQNHQLAICTTQKNNNIKISVCFIYPIMLIFLLLSILKWVASFTNG